MTRDEALKEIFERSGLDANTRVYKHWFNSKDKKLRSKFTPNIATSILIKYGYVIEKESEWRKKSNKKYQSEKQRVVNS